MTFPPQIFALLLPFLALTSLYDVTSARHVPSRHAPVYQADDKDYLASLRSAYDEDPDEEELWLKDFDGGNNPEHVEGMLGDAPVSSASAVDSHNALDAWICPPPPDKLPPYSCDMKKCRSDQECAGPSQKCCLNGCLYTCLNTLPPPPLVDWLKEPPRRLLAGHSWLVGGPESPAVGKAESCTTDFEPDEDALLCPDGYTCHILAAGDPVRGVPNRGRCVKDAQGEERDDTRRKDLTNRRRFRLAMTRPTTDGTCVLDDAVFGNGARFMYQHHPCECQYGSIMCTVGERPPIE